MERLTSDGPPCNAMLTKLAMKKIVWSRIASLSLSITPLLPTLCDLFPLSVSRVKQDSLAGVFLLVLQQPLTDLPDAPLTSHHLVDGSQVLGRTPAEAVGQCFNG